MTSFVDTIVLISQKDTFFLTKTQTDFFSLFALLSTNTHHQPTMPLFSFINRLLLLLLPPTAVLASTAATGYVCTGSDSECTISTPKANGGVCEITAVGLPHGSHLHVKLTGVGSQYTVDYKCFGIDTSDLDTCNVTCTDGCEQVDDFTECPDSGGAGGSNSGGGSSTNSGDTFFNSGEETVYVCPNNEYCSISAIGSAPCVPIGKGLPFGTTFMPSLLGAGSGSPMPYDCIGIENSYLESNGGYCLVTCPGSCTINSGVTSFSCSTVSDDFFSSVSSAGRAVTSPLVVGLAALAAGGVLA